MLKKKKNKVLNYYKILMNKFLGRGLSLKAYNFCLFLLNFMKFNFKLNNKVVFKILFNLLELYVKLYKKKVGGNVYLIPLYLKKDLRLKKGLINMLHILKNNKKKN